ncbi:hypothetical protein D3C87_332170 [compost metagenome]
MTDEVRRFTRFATNRSIPNEVKAAISKLGADPHGNSNQRKNMRLPDGRVLAHVANTTIGNIRDARNLFQVLPDMDYARQIVNSATISPGDLTDTKVLYTIKDASMDSNLSGPLLRKVQEFFDNSYRIRPLLQPILNDVLFETGSYPILIMPESSIDRIINADNYGGVSMESAVQTLDGHLRQETDQNGNYVPWGILGNSGADKAKVDSYTGVSFESLSFGADQRAGNWDGDVKVSNFKVSLEQLLVDVEENKEARTKLTEASTKLVKLVESKGSTIQVTDNLSILKRPMVVDAKRKIAVRRIYGGKLHQRASLESRAQEGDKEAMRNLAAVERSMYQKRRYQHVPVQPLLTHAQTGMDTYGHPLVMHLPSESVIPIHVPGNPSEHVGYYVMLDIDGNPINIADQSSYIDDIRSQMNNVDSYASQIIQQARRGFDGSGGMQNEIVDELGKVYSDTVERDLLARLRSGALSGNYELGKTENINRMMFARHMKGQKTVMLFVPPEMMTYIAFDYNEFGVGKSVLEDGKILGSIRASIMLANTLATLNNAVGGKTIEIELDPEDEDPVSTVEFMLSEHAKVNSQGFSKIIGSTHPLGLADQIQNHGVNVVVSGNSRYPETKFNVNQRDGQNKPVDADFEETMRRRHIQMFGLSPEVMEGINQTDFATTVVQNNLMLLKRVIQNQEKFEPFLTDFVRRYVLNSGIFLTEMRQLIHDNKQYLPEHITQDPALSGDEMLQVDAFLYEFIEALCVGLPAPEVGDIKKSMDSFDAYSEALDKVIDAYLNEEMFAADTSIGMEELIPNIKAVVKAEFQRRWLRHNNVMPELDVFNTVTEEEGSPVFDLLEATVEHVDGLNNSISEYVKRVVKAAKRRAKVLEKLATEKADLENAKNSATAGGDGGDGGLGDGADPTLDADPNADPNADPSLGGGDEMDFDTDPNADPDADPLADPNADPDADPNADPMADLDADPNADPAADADPNADPAAELGDASDVAALDAPEGGEAADPALADVDATVDPDADPDAAPEVPDLDAEPTDPVDPELDVPDPDAEPAAPAEPDADAPIPDVDPNAEPAPEVDLDAPEPEVDADAPAPDAEPVDPDAAPQEGDVEAVPDTTLGGNNLDVADLDAAETAAAEVDAENPDLAPEPPVDENAAAEPAEGLETPEPVEEPVEPEEVDPDAPVVEDEPAPEVDPDAPVVEDAEPVDPDAEPTDPVDPDVDPVDPVEPVDPDAPVEEPEPTDAEPVEPAPEGEPSPEPDADPAEQEEEEEETEEDKEASKNKRKADAAIKALKLPNEGGILDGLPDNPAPKV